MVARKTYPSLRADNLPFFGPSAHGYFLLFHPLDFQTQQKLIPSFMMLKFLKRFFAGS
jgi:hypothetical protein